MPTLNKFPTWFKIILGVIIVAVILTPTVLLVIKRSRGTGPPKPSPKPPSKPSPTPVRPVAQSYLCRPKGPAPVCRPDIRLPGKGNDGVRYSTYEECKKQCYIPTPKPLPQPTLGPNGSYKCDFIIGPPGAFYPTFRVEIELHFEPVLARRLKTQTTNLMWTNVTVYLPNSVEPDPDKRTLSITCPLPISGAQPDTYTLSSDGEIILDPSGCIGFLITMAEKAVGSMKPKSLKYNKSNDTIEMKFSIPSITISGYTLPKIGPRLVVLSKVGETPPPLPDGAVCGENLNSGKASCKSGTCANCCASDHNYYCCPGGKTFSSLGTWCAEHSSNFLLGEKPKSCHSC